MLQNTSKTLGFQKIMVYKTPPGGGGKPYLARGLFGKMLKFLRLSFVCDGQGAVRRAILSL